MPRRPKQNACAQNCGEKHPSIVVLHGAQAQVRLTPAERSRAIQAAYLVTLSPHEHTWTLEDQAAMARYTLWAHQRLSAVAQVADGELNRA